MDDPMLAKGWLPDGMTENDLDDGDFAWLSDAYKAGKESKSAGRKLPYKIHGTVNVAGWKAAWSRAHQAGTDFSGGPSQAAVIATLARDKPAGVDTAKADSGIQRKVCTAADLKFFDGNAGNGSISGYLSTFNNWDRGKEMVLPGAYAKHLDHTMRDGFLTINHNWDALPIGTFTDLHEDDRGLYFAADFHSTQAAQDARTVARERADRGKSVSTSIGYKVEDSERTKDGLLLKDLPLFEGSLVNVPMNVMALVGAVKGYSDTPPPDADDDTPDSPPPTGMRLADHFETVLLANSELVSRFKAFGDLLAKEGRVFSGTNVSRMQAVADSLVEHAGTLRDMCALAAPKSEIPPAAADEARRELNRFLQLQAHYLGVSI